MAELLIIILNSLTNIRSNNNQVHFDWVNIKVTVNDW